MDFGGWAFTPDHVAGVLAGFVIAGATLGVLLAALSTMVDSAAGD